MTDNYKKTIQDLNVLADEFANMASDDGHRYLAVISGAILAISRQAKANRDFHRRTQQAESELKQLDSWPRAYQAGFREGSEVSENKFNKAMADYKHSTRKHFKKLERQKSDLITLVKMFLDVEKKHARSDLEKRLKEILGR